MTAAWRASSCDASGGPTPDPLCRQPRRAARAPGRQRRSRLHRSLRSTPASVRTRTRLRTRRSEQTAIARASRAGATHHPRRHALLRRSLRRLPRLPRAAPREAHRVLAPHGSLYFHIDYREVHYCKVLLDEHLRARAASSTRSSGPTTTAARPTTAGRPSTTRSSSTRKDPGATSSTPSDRAHPVHGAGAGRRRRRPRAASSRPTPGGTPSCRTDRPREAPATRRRSRSAILRRIVPASSPPGRPGARLLRRQRHDRRRPALELGRRFVLVDDNPEALAVMARRFAAEPGIAWIGFDPAVDAPSQAP